MFEVGVDVVGFSEVRLDFDVPSAGNVRRVNGVAEAQTIENFRDDFVWEFLHGTKIDKVNVNVGEGSGNDEMVRRWMEPMCQSWGLDFSGASRLEIGSGRKTPLPKGAASHCRRHEKGDVLVSYDVGGRTQCRSGGVKFSEKRVRKFNCQGLGAPWPGRLYRKRVRAVQLARNEGD